MDSLILYHIAQSTDKMNLSHEWANNVYVDEVSQSECQKLCRLLEAIFAQAVGREVYNLGKERCRGCELIIPVNDDTNVSCWRMKKSGRCLAPKR